jgi:hypothetical protein
LVPAPLVLPPVDAFGALVASALAGVVALASPLVLGGVVAWVPPDVPPVVPPPDVPPPQAASTGAASAARPAEIKKRRREWGVSDM